MIFELSIPLRGAQAIVWLTDIVPRSLDEIHFVYRVIVTDPEDDSEAELTQPTQDEREQIYQAILQELPKLCS